jgi:hypothetical protein
MLAVFAEFERSIIQERINARIARARVKGTKSGKAIGRPTTAAPAFSNLAVFRIPVPLASSARICSAFALEIVHRTKRESNL